MLHPSQVGAHLAAVSKAISDRINAECAAAVSAHPEEVERGKADYEAGKTDKISLIHSPDDDQKTIAYEHGRMVAAWCAVSEKDK